MTDEPEVLETLRKLRYDLTSAQAKLTDALTMLADMNLTALPTKTCPKCHIRLPRTITIDDHLANVHDQ